MDGALALEPLPHRLGPTDLDAFEEGPPRRLSRLVGLREPLLPNTPIRALAVVAICWLPLVGLSLAYSPTAGANFLRDLGVHARYAVAAPLFVIAWVTCARRLGEVAEGFLTVGIVPAEREDDLRQAIARARFSLRSLRSEILVVGLAYGTVTAVVLLAPTLLSQSPWERGAAGGLSPAGWWHVAVSLPMLIVILLGWLWRTIVWTLFLAYVARMDLRLVAAHPDQAAGLGFLSHSVRSYALVGMAFGSLTAGRMAFVNLNGLQTPLTIPLLVGVTVVVSLLLGLAPLLVFTPRLLRTWRYGAIRYGALGRRIGGQFERRWFAAGEEEPMLGEPDFSASTDLYQVVGNVYAIRLIPADTRSILILAIAGVAPFLPAMFLSMPLEDVLRELRGLVS